jgi:CheY-like chemotaxis protein
MERRHSPNPPARPLVLLVDGHDDTLAFSAIALSAMGFEVMMATDATEAFGRAWTSHPDIIVTELLRENTSGQDLIERLKGEVRTRDIPIVVVTADARSAAHERARREGCAALLVKPCLPDRLALKLREVLSPDVCHARVARSH